MESKKKSRVVEVFQYDGDLKDRNGEYCVPEWAVKAFEAGVLYYDSVIASNGMRNSGLFLKNERARYFIYSEYFIVKEEDGTLWTCDPDDFGDYFTELPHIVEEKASKWGR